MLTIAVALLTLTPKALPSTGGRWDWARDWGSQVPGKALKHPQVALLTRARPMLFSKLNCPVIRELSVVGPKMDFQVINER